MRNEYNRTVSVEESARWLGISRGLAYEAVRRGTFPTPVFRIGGRYIIPRAPLEELLGVQPPNSGYEQENDMD